MAESLDSFASERRFQLWAFTVSHGQLLLRSNRSDQDPTRVEVLFKGVSRVDLPAAFDGLQVRRNGDEFAAHGDGWSGSVTALAMFAAEDGLGYADPSSLYVGGVE